MKSVALVDDHVLLRQGLANLVNTFPGYNVCFEADNGRQFVEKIKNSVTKPNAVLVDIHMPIMDGFETAAWLRKNHPNIKVLALSMSDEQEVIIKMLQAGAHGYILKNTTPDELHQALDTIINKGFYMNELVTLNLLSAVTKRPVEAFDTSDLNEREVEFLRLCATDLSLNEIADAMNLSVKTMDFYKKSIEKKTGISGRISLVRFAIKSGIVEP
jgi:DNA-binding NarL/FixJ family response regulator